MFRSRSYTRLPLCNVQKTQALARWRFRCTTTRLRVRGNWRILPIIGSTRSQHDLSTRWQPERWGRSIAARSRSLFDDVTASLTVVLHPRRPLSFAALARVSLLKAATLAEVGTPDSLRQALTCTMRSWFVELITMGRATSKLERHICRGLAST